MEDIYTLSFIDREPIFSLIQKYDQDGINKACEEAINSETILISDKNDKTQRLPIVDILKVCENRPFIFANVLTWESFRMGCGTNFLRYDM